MHLKYSIKHNNTTIRQYLTQLYFPLFNLHFNIFPIFCLYYFNHYTTPPWLQSNIPKSPIYHKIIISSIQNMNSFLPFLISSIPLFPIPYPLIPTPLSPRLSYYCTTLLTLPPHLCPNLCLLFLPLLSWKMMEIYILYTTVSSIPYSHTPSIPVYPLKAGGSSSMPQN